MPRLRNVRSGAVVSCSDETAARLGSGWVDADGVPAAVDEGYASKSKADLVDLITARNADREKDDLLPVKGTKPVLIAALEADDASDSDDTDDAGDGQDAGHDETQE